MFDIEKWSKEQVHDVMRELLFSFNYMWFLMEDWVKRNCPDKIDNEDFQRLSEEFGTYEAGRLAKVVGDAGEGVERLMRFVQHSHWCAFEEIELTALSDKRLRMRTMDCTAQRAAKKWGMDHYACGKQALRLRNGFFQRIDPTAQVTRVFTPPDERPQDTPERTSCEWIITID